MHHVDHVSLLHGNTDHSTIVSAFTHAQDAINAQHAHVALGNGCYAYQAVEENHAAPNSDKLGYDSKPWDVAGLNVGSIVYSYNDTSPCSTNDVTTLAAATPSSAPAPTAVKKTGSAINNTLPQKIDPILEAINEMREYGEQLGVYSKQGATAIALATELSDQIKILNTLDLTKPDTTRQFENNFLKLLHSKDSEFSQYRVQWSTITKNILIAMTGIGLFAIAGKLLHSKITTGRALFFFQEDKTSREYKRDNIESAFKHYSPA